MIFPGFTITSFVLEGVLLVLISIIGFFFFRWYSREKGWEYSFMNAFFIIGIWFVIEFCLGVLVPYLFNVSFLTESLISNISIINIMIIGVNIFIGLIIFVKFIKKPLKDSIIFTVVVQGLIFGIATIIRILLGVFITMITTDNEDISASGSLFFMIIMILFGITVFYVNWGDKIQFVKYRNIIILISFIPELIYLQNQFDVQGDAFIRQFSINIMWTILVLIISTTIVKQVSYRTISLKEFKILPVLEKGIELLKVKDLKVYYPLYGGILKRQFGSVKAVDGISFTIRTGETVGLVGESGCGKTTVALSILGLVPKESGEVEFHNNTLLGELTREMRRKIQFVFQDPDASLNPRMKIVDIIAEPLKNLLGVSDKTEIRKRVLKLLDEVSLKREHMDRYPHEFSGGQKQRIVIARALASNPELIILDEPTSALDVSVQAQILNLLKDLQATYGYGFMFITHNLAVVNHIADRIAVMYLGKFVEVGNTDQIFSNPSHPYTQALLESRTELDPTNKEIRFVIKGEVPSPIAPPPGCSFNPRCISEARTSDCMRKAPHKMEIEEGHYIWCVNPPIPMQSKVTESKERLSLE
ncbi:MAG: ABC transporter ATP-binding protein [Promethearchaeota archaeon]